MDGTFWKRFVIEGALSREGIVFLELKCVKRKE